MKNILHSVCGLLEALRPSRSSSCCGGVLKTALWAGPWTRLSKLVLKNLGFKVLKNQKVRILVFKRFLNNP